MAAALPLAFATLAALLPGAPDDGLTREERAGRRIYFEGQSGSGAEIRGLVGKEGTAVPAAAVTCAGCHGDDGLGRPEGAVEPSVITWSKLTTPYGITHPSGRRHPPYDERTLARAIAEGVDPAGNPLDWAMPRFSMPGEDLRALVAFLQRLETQADPGVTRASVRLGTVLPGAGRLAATGAAIRALLEAHFQEVNAGGGINGRRLLLEVAEFDGDAGTGLAEARRLIESGRVTALLSPYLPGAERELAALAEEARIPLVGPFTPVTRSSGSSCVFYVVAGIREQARALAEHAARHARAGARVAVLQAEGEPFAEAAQAARAQLAARGGPGAELHAFASGKLDPGTAGRLRRKGVGAVVFLGPERDLARLLQAAAAASWRPEVRVPGVLASRDLGTSVPAFQGTLLVAYPSGPGDEKPAVASRFAGLQGRSRAEPRHRAAQVSAFLSASVLAEGLRRSGRNLSRERLLRSLEGLVEFETGLAPPLTFGPGRRIGVQGAHLVALDPRSGSLRPVGWQRVD